MEYAVCQLGVAAVRAESSDRSEMVTRSYLAKKSKSSKQKKTGSGSKPIMTVMKAGQTKNSFWSCPNRITKI